MSSISNGGVLSLEELKNTMRVFGQNRTGAAILSDIQPIQTLRMPYDEAKYQQDKDNKVVLSIDKIPAIAETFYWKIVPNTYPYSMILSDHVMIVAKNINGKFPADWSDLSHAAKVEYHDLIRPLLLSTYEIIFENSLKRRSVPGIYHIHAGNIKLSNKIRILK
jgi:hypothetical protein